jgi:hypothetical protein
MTIFDDLQPLDAADLCELDTEELPTLADFELQKYGEAVDIKAQSIAFTPYIRTAKDLRCITNAVNDIGTLPVEGESRHILLPGLYTPFNLVHAIQELSGQPISELRLVTLSFSGTNTVDLLTMLDNGTVKRCWLMASNVFKAKNPTIWTPMADGLEERHSHAMVCRNHCKVFLLKMEDGSCYTIEGSGNMRSCVSLEQAAIVRDAKLHDFHAGWIKGLFEADREKRKDEAGGSQSNHTD